MRVSSRISYLALWDKELRAGKDGQKRDESGSWKCTPLLAAACAEAYANDHPEIRESWLTRADQYIEQGVKTGLTGVADVADRTDNQDPWTGILKPNTRKHRVADVADRTGGVGGLKRLDPFRGVFQ